MVRKKETRKQQPARRWQVADVDFAHPESEMGHPLCRRLTWYMHARRLWHTGSLIRRRERFRSTRTEIGGGPHLRSCCGDRVQQVCGRGSLGAACRKPYPTRVRGHTRRVPGQFSLPVTATGRIWNVSFSLTRPIGGNRRRQTVPIGIGCARGMDTSVQLVPSGPPSLGLPAVQT